MIGLGSSDGSSTGGGWVIKSKKLPNIKTTMEKTQQKHNTTSSPPAAAVGTARSEVLKQREGIPKTVVTAPTPSPPQKQLKVKIKKVSALPTHPAAEGTPQLDTIPDEPRSAPTIVGVERAEHRGHDRSAVSAGGGIGGGGAGARGRSESDGGPPDIFGRGSMTDQHFVRSTDRQFADRQVPKRSMIRVDARGRIVRS